MFSLVWFLHLYGEESIISRKIIFFSFRKKNVVNEKRYDPQYHIRKKFNATSLECPRDGKKGIQVKNDHINILTVCT